MLPLPIHAGGITDAGFPVASDFWTNGAIRFDYQDQRLLRGTADPLEVAGVYPEPARWEAVNGTPYEKPLNGGEFGVSPLTAIVAKFGEENAQVTPSQSVTVKPPRSGSGAYSVAIDCFFSGVKEPFAPCRSTWQHEANARQFLLVTPMPRQKNPRIWSILDRPEPVSPDFQTRI